MNHKLSPVRNFLAGAMLAVVIAPSSWAQEPAVAPAAQAIATSAKPVTELFDYVRAADESYKWNVKKEARIGKTTYAELIVTSQTWRDKPWRHQMFVLTPKSCQATNQHALMVIAGGAWRDGLADKERETKLPREALLFSAAAEKLGMPVVILLQVPQQPMFDDLYEDALISHTFEQYMRTGESDWPLLLPMTKSAVRGMDTAQAYLRSKADAAREAGGESDVIPAVKKFIVTGASKRGWTTWLSSVVDERVDAIAPMVIDVLNMPQQMKYMEECWGAQSEQIRDYTEKGLHKLMETERGRRLNQIVDPYAYRKQIDQPKYLLLGTNDPYWPVDALNIYWDELQGPKHILYVPNAGHGLDDMTRVVGSLVNFGRFSAAGKTLPEIDWKHDRDGDESSLQMKVPGDKLPEKVRLWTASSDDRDFRDERWTSTEMAQDEVGVWMGKSACSDSGYHAVFGEAQFAGESMPYYLSTTIEVYQSK